MLLGRFGLRIKVFDLKMYMSYLKTASGTRTFLGQKPGF